ncbi:MAG: YceD family protein [Candidatus Omnitrophota bacterium]
MKIDINKIPIEGLFLEEDIVSSELDLDTQAVKFQGALKVRADIFIITNAVTVSLQLSGAIGTCCSRCLKEYSLELKKKLQLNYPADNRNLILDLNPDIREEIILDYPVKPLCSQDCKGLCPGCGNNLNEGGCSCAIT